MALDINIGSIYREPISGKFLLWRIEFSRGECRNVHGMTLTPPVIPQPAT